MSNSKDQRKKGVAATTPHDKPISKLTQNKDITLSNGQATVLRYLVEGKPFTKVDMLNDEGIWRTPQVIYELRKLGFPIKTVTCHPDYNHGKKGQLAIYLLDHPMEEVS